MNEFTLEQLKAAAFDLSRLIEVKKQQLQQVLQAISHKENEPNQKTNGTKEDKKRKA